MYSLETTNRFLKTAAKFFKRHPELKNRFELLIETLCLDPFQNKLRLQPLKGELKGLYAVSLTYQYRVTLLLIIKNNKIILIDIGSHDEVYNK